MADQRKNAGNIGDVVKHAILPELVSFFDKQQKANWVYCETHAGFYDYPLDLLHSKTGHWSGERAWGIGLIQPDHHQRLGLYGNQLGVSFHHRVYPGSICLVDAVASKNATICGRDIGNEQVESYLGISERIKVSNGDGYLITHDMPQTARFVFCDPFWEGKMEAEKVQTLLEKEEAVVVWYPLSTDTVPYRKWQQKTTYSFIEVEFIDYKPRKGGWSGQGDMKGAGLTIKGLPPEALIRAREIGMVLKDIFAGKTDKGRLFDLRVTISN